MKKALITIASIVFTAFVPFTVFAANVPGNAGVSGPGEPGLDDAQDDFAEAGLPTNEPTEFIANLIKWILGIIGVILVIVFVYAGVLYATSFGNSGRSDQAKTMMISALIGALVVFGAFIASDFVISALVGSGNQL